MVVSHAADQLQRLENLPLMIAVKTDALEQGGDVLLCGWRWGMGKKGSDVGGRIVL